MHSKWVPSQNLGISNSERKILSSMGELGPAPWGSSAWRHGGARPRPPWGSSIPAASRSAATTAMASSAPAAWASSVAAARRSSTLAQPWRELDPGGLGERRRHGRARPRRPGGARPWRGHGGSSTPAAMGELNPGRQQLPASRLAAATAMGELDPGLEERDGLEDAYLGSQWCATQNRSPVCILCWRTFFLPKILCITYLWVWVTICLLCWRQSELSYILVVL